MITFSAEADATALTNGTDYRLGAAAASHLKTRTPAALETAGLAFGAIEAAVNIMVGPKIMSDNLTDPA